MKYLTLVVLVSFLSSLVSFNVKANLIVDFDFDSSSVFDNNDRLFNPDNYWLRATGFISENGVQTPADLDKTDSGLGVLGGPNGSLLSRTLATSTQTLPTFSLINFQPGFLFDNIEVFFGLQEPDSLEAGELAELIVLNNGVEVGRTTQEGPSGSISLQATGDEAVIFASNIDTDFRVKAVAFDVPAPAIGMMAMFVACVMFARRLKA